MQLNEEQVRVLAWIRDNEFDRTGWTERDGIEVMELRGRDGAIDFSKATAAGLSSMVQFTPPSRRGRVFELTEQASRDLEAAQSTVGPDMRNAGPAFL